MSPDSKYSTRPERKGKYTPSTTKEDSRKIEGGSEEADRSVEMEFGSVKVVVRYLTRQRELYLALSQTWASDDDD